MSCSGGSCTRATNNASAACPARMADGRAYTDYAPRCMMNYGLKVQDNTGMTSLDYRTFLIHNAETIMSQNSARAYNQNVSGDCVQPFNVGTMLPEQQMQTCNERTCSYSMPSPGGLGMGRDYGRTQEQVVLEGQFYGAKQRESERLASCSRGACAQPVDNAMLYPVDGRIPAYDRYATPSGGKPFA